MRGLERLKDAFEKLGLSSEVPPCGLCSVGVSGQSDASHGGPGLQEGVFPHTGRKLHGIEQPNLNLEVPGSTGHVKTFGPFEVEN